MLVCGLSNGDKYVVNRLKPFFQPTNILFFNKTTDIKKKLFFTAIVFNITVAAFRNVLRKANEKLSQVLVDVLKTTAAAEETMGLHMQSLRDASSRGQQAATPHSTTERANTEPVRPYAAGK